MSFEPWCVLPDHLTKHYLNWCTPVSINNSPSSATSNIGIFLDRGSHNDETIIDIENKHLKKIEKLNAILFFNIYMYTFVFDILEQAWSPYE